MSDRAITKNIQPFYKGAKTFIFFFFFFDYRLTLDILRLCRILPNTRIPPNTRLCRILPNTQKVDRGMTPKLEARHDP